MTAPKLLSNFGSGIAVFELGLSRANPNRIWVGISSGLSSVIYKNGKFMRTEKINFSGPFILPKKQ